MKVAIADDTSKVCTMIARIITEHFPQLTIDGIFQTGTALMSYLENNTPDLLISDIVMPGFDGLDACQALRRKSSDARIILITAFPKFEFAKAGIMYHVNDFLVKPYTTEQMIKAISKAIGLDAAKLARDFMLAQKELYMDFWLSKNKKMLSTLSETQMQDILSEVGQLLGVSLNPSDFSLADPMGCFHKLSDIYYNDNSHKYIVQKATDYILNHYSDVSLSRTVVADYLSISESYLSKLFKEETNTGLSSYIAQVRIDAAKELLSNSKMSISEIATATGFNSSKYFHETFKKITHITPAQYQTRKRTNENN